MNTIINHITQHRSYRHFKKSEVMPQAHIDAIFQAAHQAPSWMNGQHYSIVRITDTALRQKIAAAQPHNPQVGDCSEFWIFIADAHRSLLCSEACGSDFKGSAPETLMIVSVDTALAAQNAVIAAESLDYGTCVVGGVRQIAAQLIDWLSLPKYTFPLLGLCIGKPDIDMRVKPRLPENAVLFENRYGSDAQLAANLAAYEQTMTEFGEAREKLPFREKFARFYSKPHLSENIQLLKQQGLLADND
ncbi:nitroreductase family protein [Stenoxybacter acetivorans]|uniref:nitroreductase family protein n=1 Tax=Stenoxybacter acetivorans TaxID=422441 RepID=UPI00056751BD|nr:nitroreductase family protein [Stenoxybacter acetivorans]